MKKGAGTASPQNARETTHSRHEEPRRRGQNARQLPTGAQAGNKVTDVAQDTASGPTPPRTKVRNCC
eukprot:2478391-Pleurochrysis_carterae.AAC.4